MKRKSIMLFSLAVFAFASITGCSSGAPSSGNSNTTTNQAPANTANIISEDEAKQAALQDAGIQETDITGFRSRLETDDGVQEYEIDFYANNQEYEYSIAAADGSIRSKDIEKNSITNTQPPTIVSEEDAKTIAFQDAGVQETDITGLRVRLETDDGVQEYEIDFYANNQEYEYSIAAADGSIRNKDIETSNINTGTSSNGISEEQAKQIALAKVAGAQDSDIHIKSDKDDGKLVYEGSIIYNKTEYEFEIDAANGTILSWEEDSIYD